MCTTYSKPSQIICCHMVFKDMLILSCVVGENLVYKKKKYNWHLINKKMNYSYNYRLLKLEYGDNTQTSRN
jgi:hypothetical protein